jgi:hypothetical protein
MVKNLLKRYRQRSMTGERISVKPHEVSISHTRPFSRFNRVLKGFEPYSSPAPFASLW